MNSVDKVKMICKERKIPISKLEKECGFSNGYIGQLRKGTMPADRLMKVAAFLGVEPSVLFAEDIRDTFVSAYKETQEKDDAIAVRERLRSSPELKILFDATEDAPPSALLEAAALILRYKEQSK